MPSFPSHIQIPRDITPLSDAISHPTPTPCTLPWCSLELRGHQQKPFSIFKTLLRKFSEICPQASLALLRDAASPQSSPLVAVFSHRPQHEARPFSSFCWNPQLWLSCHQTTWPPTPRCVIYNLEVTGPHSLKIWVSGSWFLVTVTLTQMILPTLSSWFSASPAMLAFITIQSIPSPAHITDSRPSILSMSSFPVSKHCLLFFRLTGSSTPQLHCLGCHNQWILRSFCCSSLLPFLSYKFKF